MAALRVRRASGHQQQRHVVARGVHQRTDCIAGAHRYVNHDAGRLAGHLVVAVRHRDGEILVRNREELRCWLAAPGERHEPFDDRCEIGARIREHVLHAPPLQSTQKRLGHRPLLRCPFAPSIRCLQTWHGAPPGARANSLKEVVGAARALSKPSAPCVAPTEPTWAHLRRFRKRPPRAQRPPRCANAARRYGAF